MVGSVFISHQSRHSCFDVVITKVIFANCTLTWRVNKYVSRQGKGINKRTENTRIIIFCTDNNN